MDNNLLLIIFGSSVIFIGIVVWKIRWLFKKIKIEEQKQIDNGQD